MCRHRWGARALKNANARVRTESCATSHCSRRLTTFHIRFRKQQLHVNHIEPAIELVPDAFKVTDRFEPKTRMQSHAGFVGAVNRRDNRMHSDVLCAVD